MAFADSGLRVQFRIDGKLVRIKIAPTSEPGTQTNVNEAAVTLGSASENR
jgi:hypothetical protein